jgi:pyruvate dehydrogenase E1 component alpha subunit
MKQILKPDGSMSSEQGLEIPQKELLKWYEIMVSLRILDEKGMRLQRQGRIGFHVPLKGQEAHVGAAAALKESDWIFPSYREHGCALYRGLPITDIINHMFANDLDPQKARRIPGLFGDNKLHFVTPSAPIGTQIIHAVGAAYGAKYLKDGNVTLVFFGDGATSSNDFHSGMNFAGVFNVPVILMCQNNGWAISMPRVRQTAAKKLTDKAIGYGMPGIQIDGNDIFAIYTTVKEAAERARKGEGPTFIESVTYRMGPHTSSDDPTKYRSKEEVEKWEKLDPITRFEKYLINSGIIKEKEAKDTWSKKDQEIKDLLEEASKRDHPHIDTMFTDVFSEMTWNLKEQLEVAKKFGKVVK